MKEPIGIICLSHYDGGMELDSIKLAKKLSVHTKVVLIVKENSFIHHQIENDPLLTFETISFITKTSFSIIFKTRQYIKKHNLRNIIFFGASEMKSLYFSFLGLNINLIIRHGTTKSSPKKDWFHKLIYSRVNYHIALSQHLLNNVKYIIPFTSQTKTKLIPSSFPSSKPIHKDHEGIVLLHTGRIAEGKGQIDAIKACSILVQNNIDFTFNIIGNLDPTFRETFYQTYNACAYKHKINLIGFTNDVKYYMEKSDIFIFPSYGEGLSNSFLEALGNNLVCLSYNNTFFPELIKLSLYFTIVEDRNILDLKSKLLKVVQNLEEEQRLSRDNNKIIKEKFSLKNEMDAYLEILV